MRAAYASAVGGLLLAALGSACSAAGGDPADGMTDSTDGTDTQGTGDTDATDDTDETGGTDDTSTGVGDLADCSFDDGLSFDGEGTVLQLESASADVCVRLERRNDGPGDYANTAWTLLDARVGPLGEVSHVDDQQALCWYDSHHNFLDWAHIWTTEGRHYDVKLKLDDHGGNRTYELHTFASGPAQAMTCGSWADGTDPIGGPIELFPFNP